MATDLFDRHRATLDRAIEACRSRESWTAFGESPADHPGGERARAEGRAAFEALLGRPFDLGGPGAPVAQPDEVSPYTGEPLGVCYPRADVEELFAAATRAWPRWREADPRTRAGVCLEICERIYLRSFEFSYAAMHTAGQSFGMSYAGSGTNALDRGIEAIAQAYAAMSRVPGTARWSRAFGTTTVEMVKRYRLMPKGVAVVIACASFPAWNVYPALFASLVTGNPVIVKPHPGSVLQMALAVRVCREVLAEAGFSPELVGLAVDTAAEPVTRLLVRHPATRIVDFTGSAAFGSWVEANAFPAVAYTETSGANSVLVHSVGELQPVLRALAGSLCLFSAQMCTSPQNIYVPRGGVPTAGGTVSAADFATGLAEAVQAISTVPRRAAAVLATVQSPNTLRLLEEVRDRAAARGRIVLEPHPYRHPDHPRARTSGPLLAQVDIADHDLYGEERFGPVAFVIDCDDADQALERATRDARERGAITAFAYATDEAYLDRVEAGYATAGAAVTCNLTGPMPLNFSAAYSDYHVTGLNPAGNASLTDDSFVTGRFRVTQSRRPAVTGH
ncbi:phenylacetic acid degradation protein PaaN [Streptosporangium sp. NPDC049644]|uniref:phenylacetic acid degradation protein PaaN n=1 Tax=Streptosporangium sp. NPDC049644 TaxID=3155507 RepID=UPI003417C3AD